MLLVQGDFGIVLRFPFQDAQSLGPLNVVGATVTMELTAPNGITTSLAMTVGTTVDPGNTAYPVGTWVYRTTLATDFAAYGTYQVQLVANFGSRQTSSAPFQIQVFKRNS